MKALANNGLGYRDGSTLSSLSISNPQMEEAL